MLLKLLFTLLIFALLKTVKCYEKEITISVEAGSSECFYQNLKENQVLDIEYQVIDGTHGQLDISFQLLDPSGRVLAADFKNSENNHRIEAAMTGDYQFCFDNTISSFNSKTVFFEIIVEGAGDHTWGEDNVETTDQELEEIYEIQVRDIRLSVHKVRFHLNEIQHHQESIRNYEARDRNMAEENFFKVNTWSMVQITVMLVVGFIQVVMLKSLFDNTSTVHKIWKRLAS